MRRSSVTSPKPTPHTIKVLRSCSIPRPAPAKKRIAAASSSAVRTTRRSIVICASLSSQRAEYLCASQSLARRSSGAGGLQGEADERARHLLGASHRLVERAHEPVEIVLVD